MTIVFSSEQLQAISAHAESVYPEECCGILLGKPDKLDRAVVEVILTVNIWEQPELVNPVNINTEIDRTKHSRYTIDPKDIFLAQKRAREINLDLIGFFHSHPDYPAIPSKCDRDQAWEVYSYPIVSVIKGKVSDIQSWILDDNGIFQSEQIQVTIHN
jgi:proteasome lid subunit RPN8/RPN11